MFLYVFKVLNTRKRTAKKLRNFAKSSLELVKNRVAIDPSGYHNNICKTI